MKRYYYNSPRGFANEFSIISVDMNSHYEISLFSRLMLKYKKCNNPDWNLHRITYKKAHILISAEKRLRKNYEKIGLNLTNNPVGATEITTISEYYANSEYYAEREYY